MNSCGGQHSRLAFTGPHFPQLSCFFTAEVHVSPVGCCRTGLLWVSPSTFTAFPSLSSDTVLVQGGRVVQQFASVVRVEPAGSRSRAALGFRPHTEGGVWLYPSCSQEPGSGLCILGLLFVEKQTHWSAREWQGKMLAYHRKHQAPSPSNPLEPQEIALG